MCDMRMHAQLCMQSLLTASIAVVNGRIVPQEHAAHHAGDQRDALRVTKRGGVCGGDFRDLVPREALVRAAAGELRNGLGAAQG